ncbi:MAG TPA: hypothetical protein EYP14_12350 [Planctomycetaceae bacterium]|nr:hypothetical protein [Planctomycetaceae bacterium]
MDGRRFALAYFAELQKIPGFQVVPVGVTEQALYDNKLQMQGPKDALELARILGVDIVVVGAVTDYDPYYPPRVGLQVSWYSPYAVELPLPMALPADDAVVGEPGGIRGGIFRCPQPLWERARAVKASLQRLRPPILRHSFRLNGLDFLQRAQSPEELLEDWEPIGADRAGAAELEQSTVERSETESSETERLEAEQVEGQTEESQPPQAVQPEAEPRAGGPSATDASEFDGSAPAGAERANGPPRVSRASQVRQLSEDEFGVARLSSDPSDAEAAGASDERSNSPDERLFENSERVEATPKIPPVPDPLVLDETVSSFPTEDRDPTAQERPGAAEPGARAQVVADRRSQTGLASGEGERGLRSSVAAANAPAWDYSPEYHSDAFWRESRFWELQQTEADGIARTAYEITEPEAGADSGEPAGPWPRKTIGTASVAAPLLPRDPHKPLMSYSRLFDGADADLVARLRDYVELSGDRRSGGWEGYLHRSEDFIRFTTHVMIVEMLTMHGGETRRRFVFKLRKRM